MTARMQRSGEGASPRFARSSTTTRESALEYSRRISSLASAEPSFRIIDSESANAGLSALGAASSRKRAASYTGMTTATRGVDVTAVPPVVWPVLVAVRPVRRRG